MKSLLILPLFLLPLLFCFSIAHAQTGSSKEDKQAARQVRIKNCVDSQNYVFRAQTALPMSGGIRQLTSDYDLKITQHSIVSYLPYYGKAYTAPMNMRGGGIEFTSKDFDYTVTPKKNGGWDIQIKPKDVQDVQQMRLSISQNGYASLQVTSTSRQPISFNGNIAPLKQPVSK